MACEMVEDQTSLQQYMVHSASQGRNNRANGSELKVYRLALACTGEYAQYHGGTQQSVMSAMVTTMNRVNGVYEREFAVRMELIANNDTLIYYSGGSDPYTNQSGSTMLGENHSNITSVIGTQNFDIGHVFSTGGGGIADLGAVCRNQRKGRGVTGSGSPVGDPFDIDYVAHEMGHQFGGNHTFDWCGGPGSLPVEPGSASTIMGYAGLCGSADIQNHSDAYFHGGNFDEVIDFITLGAGGNCPQIVNTNNSEPQADAGNGGYTLPVETPFELTGLGQDADGDSLTYCWEQMDIGNGSQPGNPSGNAPIFRSFNPNPSPTRVFPNIDDLVNNQSSVFEVLPTYSRTLSFRLTVRDNNPAGGGVNYHEIGLSVSDQAGPFVLNHPNSDTVVWESYTYKNVEWDVANTTAAPVNCGNVDILLSEDGGYTYPHTVVANAPNNGSTTVYVPNVLGSTCRLKVKASDNVFFDVSNDNFTIVEGTPPVSGLQHDESLEVSLIQNPVKDHLLISGQPLPVNSSFQISDAFGRLMQQGLIGDHNASSPIRIELPARLEHGVYFIDINSKGKRETMRFMKQ